MRVNAEPALRVAGAKKRFRAVDALAGLSFDVARGEWVGLLGPNGAGKSTLMRSIVGLLELDGGRIEVTGRPPGEVPGAIGFVPQEIALYPLLSADGVAGFRSEGCSPGTHGIDHAAQAEQIAAIVNRFTTGLLGRHELGRTSDDANAGQTSVIGCARQAKVGDPQLALPVDHQVAGLDVTMHDAVLMSVLQRVGGLLGEPGCVTEVLLCEQAAARRDGGLHFALCELFDSECCLLSCIV